MPIVRSSSGAARNPTFTFLTDDGLPSGNINAIGDYSAVAQEFSFSPFVDTVISSLAVKMSGSGTYGTEVYGNAVGPLTNGIDVLLRVGGQEGSPFINPVFKNWDWIAQANEGAPALGSGQAPDTFITVFDFTALERGGFLMEPLKGDFIKFTLNDSFTSLDNHNFVLFTGIP